MSICVCCGREFNISTARRSTSRKYGAGVYDDYYPDGNVCGDCASEEISADYSAGAELKELMGYDYDD